MHPYNDWGRVFLPWRAGNFSGQEFGGWREARATVPVKTEICRQATCPGSHPYTRAELLRRNPDAERRSKTAIAEALPGLIARLASGELPDHERRRFGSYAGEWVETLELVARQMEALVAEGADEAAAVAALDFSSVEERFTGGDAFLAGRFDAWFKRPVGRAAYRVAVGLNPEVE